MSDKGEVVIIMSVIKMLVTCKQCVIKVLVTCKQCVIKVFVICSVIIVLMICKW